jgi:hypothetical protein
MHGLIPEGRGWSTSMTAIAAFVLTAICPTRDAFASGYVLVAAGNADSLSG